MDVVLGLLALGVLAWWLVRRNRRAAVHDRPPAPVRTRPRPLPAQRPAAGAPARMPFAAPGMRGPLFVYGGPGNGRGAGGHIHDGPYAVIDVETTGFSPAHGDRVIEIALARMDAAGRIEDEYATLLNPQGRDTGPVFVHGISNDAVADAPSFAEVAGEILARLDGAVVVAHNAVFEERFLAAEFARAGISTGPVPALCTLWLGRAVFDTPNHKLATLARHAGVPLVDAHAALGDVRAVAALLPEMLGRNRGSLTYGCPPAAGLGASWPIGVVPPRTRAVELRKGTDGWIASLLARLPMSAADVADADADRYLDALATVLEDGKIVGEEAKLLARLAGHAGMGAAQVAALNERFLEAMREAAFADDVLTPAELRTLTATAKALGVPGYFDDLVADRPAAAVPAGRTATATPSTADMTAAVPQQRRCGHCRTPGHYRKTCPELA